MNVTFTSIHKSDAYLIYKRTGDPGYTEQQIELAGTENYTFSINRTDLDPSDKDIYVVVKALGSNDSDVTF